MAEQDTASPDSGNFSFRSISTTDECLSQIPPQLNLLNTFKDLLNAQSELERASSAESWYKQELKAQKASRLEILERLYAQERKYLNENRRLQQECLQLYNKCADLEEELERCKRQGQQVPTLDFHADLELSTLLATTQQKAIMEEQQQLIILLRNQKKDLLAELEALSAEYDEKLIGLQMENSLVTDKCKRLLLEKLDMEKCLEQKEQRIRNECTEKEKLQRIITELNEAQQIQEKLLSLKENQLVEMRQQMVAELKHDGNAHKMQSMNKAYQENLTEKTHEIAALMQALTALKEELHIMSKVESENGLLTRTIEQLRFKLEERELECAHLQANDDCKATQITVLSHEKTELQKRLKDAEQRFHSTEIELIEQHQQYAELCATHEKTKYELESLNVEAANHSAELKSVREFLAAAVLKKHALSARITENEAELETSHAELRKLRKQLQEHTVQLDELQQARQHEDTNNKQNEENLKLEISVLKQQLEQLTVERAKLAKLLQRNLEQQRASAAAVTDWEQLQTALNASQKLGEQLSAELLLKNAELFELNGIFSEQNSELQKLQQIVYLLDCKRNEELRDMASAVRQQCKQSANLKLKNVQLRNLLDESNAKQPNEPNHEVANLIDDYKQLIEAAAKRSKRPNTRAILALIERSNICQPNLMKLEASLKDASADIKEFVCRLNANSNKRNEYVYGEYGAYEYIPTLMEELYTVATATAATS